MSIVEKAAEKLKALPFKSAPPVQEETARSPQAPMVERLQERTKTQDQPAESTPLCVVDPAALKRMGVLPADDQTDRRLADELRRIKRPLLDNAFGTGAETFTRARRIVVTSAEAGEGKTFTAVNLALSLAHETDFEVLLVDGDIVKSDVTRMFGLSDKPGLMDVLADEQRAPADVIVHTDVPNLLVVPAGKRHPLAAELFRSRRMEYVLDQLGGHQRGRLMVFDSPPLLGASESQVLASHMGQVVVVVAAGHTRRQVVKSALQRLNEFQYVGLILNMSSLPAGENYHDSQHESYARDR